MRVLNLPYTLHSGISQCDLPLYILQLNESEQVMNHLNTIHASALFALAETTSGYFLQTNFADIADQTIPILRSSSVKYRKLAHGTIYSSAFLEGSKVSEILDIIQSKFKVLLTISVALYNEQKELVMSGSFDWFVTLPQTNNQNP